MGTLVLRDKDPRVMGTPVLVISGTFADSVFLLTLPWARGTSISLRVLHKPLLLHNQAGWARAWVEVKAKAHRP